MGLVIMIVILLVLLAGAISAFTALAAFIITKHFGKSRFTAIRNSAVVFVTTFTLLIVTFTFVESVLRDHLGTPTAVPGNSAAVAPR